MGCFPRSSGPRYYLFVVLVASQLRVAGFDLSFFFIQHLFEFYMTKFHFIYIFSILEMKFEVVIGELWQVKERLG